MWALRLGPKICTTRRRIPGVCEAINVIVKAHHSTLDVSRGRKSECEMWLNGWSGERA